MIRHALRFIKVLTTRVDDSRAFLIYAPWKGVFGCHFSVNVPIKGEGDDGIEFGKEWSNNPFRILRVYTHARRNPYAKAAIFYVRLSKNRSASTISTFINHKPAPIFPEVETKPGEPNAEGHA